MQYQITKICLGLFLSVLMVSSLAAFTADELLLIDEHTYAGLPDSENVYVRQGYILGYDSANHIPRWVAYHVEPDYLNTPEREGSYKSFRVDPDIGNAITTKHYNGVKKARGYARGHLAPYAVMGGDRDNDEMYAIDGDGYDDTTIYQCNFITNIAPQHHKGFNNSPGLWYTLEEWVRDTLVRNRGCEVWVTAGCIVGPGEHEVVGSDSNIVVPAMFYKIVVCEYESGPAVLAFLFPHQRVAHGKIENFLVTVDVIEALTGLDFFSAMEDEAEELLEDTDTWIFWEEITAEPLGLCQ
jgi:endonuclease G